MRKRSLAREYALQILYEIDITRDDYATILGTFWHLIDGDVTDEIKRFAAELVEMVMQHRDDIDKKISRYATNWELDRMAVVDRNVLRLGGCELLYRADIPPKVSINEAVDLAKKFSGVQAGKFVNGILDKVKSERK
ncbi:MAG: transcription antitermination factor NusB [Candidatus Omnitrophota bacterium]